jgi:hypothetical protein
MECIKFELPITESANRLKGCSIHPTITEYTRRFNACVFGGYKKTTFDSGLLWPLRGASIPTFKCVEGGVIIKPSIQFVKQYGKIFMFIKIIVISKAFK